MIAAPARPADTSLASLQTAFLTILPTIESRGRTFFRHVACPVQRQEAIAEMTALAWKWFVRLAAKGKNAARFSMILSSYAARAVKSGRRLQGLEPARDALSARAQKRHRFRVDHLSDDQNPSEPVYLEALCENTVSEIPDQVCFRLDFPAWRASRCERDQRLIDDLMTGERARDVSRKYRLTPGRVSQLRREYREDWQRFCGEDAESGKAVVA
jgi:hypothetical protein